jgi:hypothetical protein
MERNIAHSIRVTNGGCSCEEVRMSSAKPVTDHNEIRRWAESNNGRPACVKDTAKGKNPGVLRLDFDEKEESLEQISWDAWFDAFEKNKLALLISPDSRFNKLVSRES